MKFIEEVRDILDVPRKYFICHASSCDLNMSSGLAHVIDNSYNLVSGLEKKYGCGYWDVGRAYFVGNIITLMVKTEAYDKVDIEDVSECLSDLKDSLEEEGINCIAFPKICCGNMGMKWREVKQLIKDTFEDDDIEILICHDKAEDITPDKDDIISMINKNYDSLTENAQIALYESVKEYFEKNIYVGLGGTGGF